VPTASEALAAFAAQVRYGDLPAAVIAKIKLHLLDLLGVALASSTMPFGRAALEAVQRAGGAGEGSVIGFPARLAPVWAALVNGTLAHGIDFDDTHQESVVHVSASVVPAALAAAEPAGAGGERLLAALAVGLESAVRLGLVARGGFHDRGFHATGICGTFAAALTAGRLLGLDRPGLADAVGLCGSMAAGSLEFLTDGTWAKRVHAGWAAHAGLTAVHLAHAGFSGPRGALDGRFGLYRSHLGDGGWDVGVLSAGLGERWELLGIGLKPYPCCHYNHAFIDCAARLRAEEGIAAPDVARVDCFVAPREMPIVCEPVATKRAPQTEYDAKFSLPYAVACMLVRGRVEVDDFTPEAIRDPAVLALAQRVECHPGPDAAFPRRFSGRLRVTRSDGRAVEREELVNRGSAERPLAEEEVREKFRRNAGRALSAERTAALLEAVQHVESARSARLLGELCAGDEHSARHGTARW
jgi:2-methylcitrate dehydratase PrpD